MELDRYVKDGQGDAIMMELFKNKKSSSENTSEKALTIRVSRVNIIANLLLAVLKFMAGTVAHSSVLVADAVNSTSDVFSSILVIIGANVSDKAADEEHPYGHERIECVISMILANLIFLVGLGIGMSGLENIFSGSYETLVVPGQLALVAAVISIVMKEGLFRYCTHAADKINSISLKAVAWDHRSDALSSVGSFVGVLGARLGYPVLDPLASVVIAVLILKAALGIYRETINRMVDRSCDAETEAAMRQLILNCSGVVKLDVLRTRLFGAKMYVEVEIEADGTLPLRQAHDIAVQVHNGIEAAFPLVKHCVVHVNPTIYEKTGIQ